MNNEILKKQWIKLCSELMLNPIENREHACLILAFLRYRTSDNNSKGDMKKSINQLNDFIEKMRLEIQMKLNVTNEGLKENYINKYVFALYPAIFGIIVFFIIGDVVSSGSIYFIFLSGFSLLCILFSIKIILDFRKQDKIRKKMPVILNEQYEYILNIIDSKEYNFNQSMKAFLNNIE